MNTRTPHICPNCRGVGILSISNPCPSCSGSGLVWDPQIESRIILPEHILPMEAAFLDLQERSEEEQADIIQYTMDMIKYWHERRLEENLILKNIQHQKQELR